MEGLNLNNIPKFENPEEEIRFLREHLAKKEKEMNEKGLDSNKEKLAEGLVQEYKNIKPQEVLSSSFVSTESEIKKLSLKLKEESHDSKIENFYQVVKEKGISNALSAISKLENPHLDDDFHRFLVQFLLSKGSIPGLKNESELFKTLDMRLFEVTLTEVAEGEQGKKTLKEIFGAMEQFYAGMNSIGGDLENKKDLHYSIEIALSEGSDNFIVYVAVPSHKSDLFEKQLLGILPRAKIVEVPDDYNIFGEKSFSTASFAELNTYGFYPIKSYETFEYDPINIILNIFTKLKKHGEGASIQFVVSPHGNKFVKKMESALGEIRDGKKVKDVYEKMNGGLGYEFKSLIGGFFESNKEEKEEKKVDDIAISNITEKIKTSVAGVNIRIVVSAEEKERAEQILTEIESSFNQFGEATKNSISFKRPKNNDLKNLIRDFSYRVFSEKQQILLSLKELVSVFHFPYGIESPQLKQTRASVSPAPIEMGDKGILMGINHYQNKETKIYMTPEDRLRHLYVIGQTGTGKTTILKNMIVQDIRNGNGCCFIDPHGSDVQDILSYVPKERIDDVIYFDPAYTARPMGLNMLEYDPRYPEQKTFVVNELMGIFNKLFSKESMGPMFEQYFKNSAFLVMDNPENKATLLEITRVLGNKEYRDSLLQTCKNPIIKEFWQNAERVTGEQSISSFVPYITSKFDNFISNDIMRPVVLQEKSVLNFREIMDNKKILLVNLSKGRLGEINANLIGLLLVGKIQMAAMSRVDMYGQKMNDFYLYMDEFQNITTDSIASILSEARKYHLSLTVAHQYISQLEETIKNAVFGNVGSTITYRVSPEDASFLEQKYKPTFSASDIMKLDNFNSYVNMLVGGIPVKPFSMTSHYTLIEKGNPEIVEKIKELSYLKYGRPREIIEQEIMEKYRKI